MVAAWKGHSSIVAELVRARAQIQIDAQDQVYNCVCVCVCVNDGWQPVYDIVYVYMYDDCVCVV